MDKKTKLHKDPSVIFRERHFGLEPLKGEISIHEKIIDHIPHYSVDINLKNLRENDIDYIVDRLENIKKELVEKFEITRSHISERD